MLFRSLVALDLENRLVRESHLSAYSIDSPSAIRLAHWDQFRSQARHSQFLSDCQNVLPAVGKPNALNDSTCISQEPTVVGIRGQSDCGQAVTIKCGDNTRRVVLFEKVVFLVGICDSLSLTLVGHFVTFGWPSYDLTHFI